MNTQPATTLRRLAGFIVGILLLTGCQSGWGATAEKTNPDGSRPTAPAASAPAAPEAATPDLG